MDRIGADHLHDSLSQALDAFRADSTSLLSMKIKPVSVT